jgi:multiple sugar transport system permease protein
LLGFANSTLVAVAVTAFQIVTSALAAYAFGLKFPGKQALLLIILATLVITFE